MQMLASPRSVYIAERCRRAWACSRWYSFPYVNAAPSGLPHCLGQEDVSDYVDNLVDLSNLR